MNHLRDDIDEYGFPTKRKRVETASFNFEHSQSQDDYNVSNSSSTTNAGLLHLIDQFQYVNNHPQHLPLPTPLTSWIPLTLQEDTSSSIFQLGPVAMDGEKGRLNFPLNSSLSEIFLTYLTPDLLKNVWNSYPVTHWIYGRGKRAGTISKGAFNLRLILICIATYIRIIGLQNDNNNKPHGNSQPNNDCSNDNGSSMNTSSESAHFVNSSENEQTQSNQQTHTQTTSSDRQNNNDNNSESQPNNERKENEETFSANFPTSESNNSHNSAHHLYNGNLTGRPQRAAICEALTYFRNFVIHHLLANVPPDSENYQVLSMNAQNEANKLPGMQTVEILFSRYHLIRSFWPIICQKFRSVVITPGRCLVGDENLLYFTGSSGFIRIVPTKPDKMGLWFFQLVCLLSNHTPYLLHAKLFDANSNQGTNIPLNVVVQEWATIANEFTISSSSVSAPTELVNNDGREGNHNHSIFSKPLLVFDSYYIDEEGREYLLNEKIPFMATVQPDKFDDLTDQFEKFGIKITKPGQSALLWNELSNEIFLHHFDLDTTIGAKYLLSNAFYPRVIRPSQLTGQMFQAVTVNNHLLFLNEASHFPVSPHSPQLRSPLPPPLPFPLPIHSHRFPSSPAYQQTLLPIPTNSPVIPRPPPQPYLSNLSTAAVAAQSVEQIRNQFSNPSVEYTYIPQQEIYNVYKNLFSTCDLYNQQIHAYKYCHKSGGCHKSGEDGLCHKFIMACILQNTIVAYRYVRAQQQQQQQQQGSVENENQTFHDLCLRLSDELFLRAMDQ